ncbi:MAG: hypothetical protein UX66_C0010G0014 [Parcubacteria group bacterium GW2011_GWF2_46_8]|nr:MAG: hypothetical protein UX66_C0010G0014 [Parcubacteria group bacterium GW2011_GWF2_46_8]
MSNPNFDFKNPIVWRIFRIMAEFVEGFELITNYHKTVSIFGSTRLKEGDPSYEEARSLAQMLGKNGFTVVTGGASGIMEAANRGASEVNAESIGLNIKLPHNFHYFFTRKVMLAFAAEAYVFFPGGFGTLDELTELITLIQTKKIKPVPIIMVGGKHWQPLLDWINTTLKTGKYIDADDTKLYRLVNSAEEAYDIILNSIKG